MTSFSTWRAWLFKSGCGCLLLSIVLSLTAEFFIPRSSPLHTKLWMLLRFADFGWFLDLLAIILILFGTGWKRIPPAILCILSALYWNAVIAY